MAENSWSIQKLTRKHDKILYNSKILKKHDKILFRKHDKHFK